MAFSGTISQTVFDTRKVIENAVRRCRLPAEQISAEYVDIARDQLYLLLADIANVGFPLWCIEKQVYPLYEGVAGVTMTDGTVDVLNVNLRSLYEASGIELNTATSRTMDFVDDVTLSSVGIKFSATPTGSLVYERSDNNIDWTTIDTVATTAVAGEWFWHDLSTLLDSRFYRVSVSAGTLSFSDIYFGTLPSEIPMARLNRDDYTNLPNKAFKSSRPLQFWFDRQVRNPVLTLWPVPDADAEHSQIVLWRQRHIMDVGTLTQEIEVPQRWYEAVVAGLAAKLAMEIVEVDPQLVAMLDNKAASALYNAQTEERDNSPVMITPNISAYTR